MICFFDNGVLATKALILYRAMLFRGRFSFPCQPQRLTKGATAFPGAGSLAKGPGFSMAKTSSAHSREGKKTPNSGFHPSKFAGMADTSLTKSLNL